MEAAGSAVAAQAKEMVADLNLQRVGIVCGPGNNGGDGFVAAQKLFAPALDLKVFILGAREVVRGNAKHHLALLSTMPILVESIDSPEPLRRFAAAGPLLWIDAMFGTGLTRKIDGVTLHCIEFLNESAQPILAVDIPSGLDADTGEILGEAIRAQVTVTFVAPKLGFAKSHGPQYAGRVVTSTIGIPQERIDSWSAHP